MHEEYIMYYMKIQTNVNKTNDPSLENIVWLPLRKPNSSIIYFDTRELLIKAAVAMNISPTEYVIGES